MNHPRSDRDFQGKKEDDPSHSKFPKIPSSSRHWSNYKNPRIVRVSRTFGGKDRHSKVCTIRGLRDRRIRLSVPTAIQLYDLQDRLGLNQPSKVVDWLLDATKLDIDKLPPLPMFPIHQPIPPPHDTSHFLSSNLGIGSMKEGIKMSEPPHDEREGFGGFVAQISAQNLFPLNNTTAQSNNPFPNFPYTSHFHWDPSNLSLSQSGGGFAAFNNNQADDNRLPLPSNSDLYFYPSASSMPSFHMPNASFPPSMENNDQLRQMINQNMASIALPTTLNLISPPVKSSSFGHHMNSKSVYSLQESDARRLLKDNNKS